jgi:hypothetical protein
VFELQKCHSGQADQRHPDQQGHSKRELGKAPSQVRLVQPKPRRIRNADKGRAIGEAYARAKWLFIPLEPGYVLLLGECGGRVLFPSPGSKVPKFHLHIVFGVTPSSRPQPKCEGHRLYEQGEEDDQYLKVCEQSPPSRGSH